MGNRMLLDACFIGAALTKKLANATLVVKILATYADMPELISIVLVGHASIYKACSYPMLG